MDPHAVFLYDDIFLCRKIQASDLKRDGQKLCCAVVVSTLPAPANAPLVTACGLVLGLALIIIAIGSTQCNPQ